uniref:FAD-binding oxidoreductase n=1 Tax=Acinetobacter baumannii TaxID=470 RepID=UPI001C08F48F
ILLAGGAWHSLGTTIGLAAIAAPITAGIGLLAAGVLSRQRFAGRTARVEPGIVLDDLNRQLKKHGLWFPVDVSTASRATIGGMTANNS